MSRAEPETEPLVIAEEEAAANDANDLNEDARWSKAASEASEASEGDEMWEAPESDEVEVPLVSPAATVNGEYEEVPTANGGYKRRRVGAKQWRWMCHHGRQRSTCKECGGLSICEHGRRRSECKECGGASICEHDRRRSTCKVCEGSGIC